MEMRFFKNGELKDKEIVKALQQAAVDYDNGEIAEVRDLLVDIVQAIDEFDASEQVQYSGKPVVRLFLHGV